MTISFDSVTLPTRSPIVSGRVGSLQQEWTFECLTAILSDIDTLHAKCGRTKVTTLLNGKTSVQTTGTVGSLVVDGTTYTNCSIVGPIEVREVPGSNKGLWIYTVKIVRNTSL